MRVLLDTNFLLVPGKFKVDIFQELAGFGKTELFTLDVVMAELRKIARQKGRDARYAKLALRLVKDNGVKIVETTGGNADAEILRMSIEHGYVVCTLDRELKERLMREGVTVIFLRQGRFLVKL